MRTRSNFILSVCLYILSFIATVQLFISSGIFTHLFVFRYIFKQRRSETKDISNIFFVCSFIYHLIIIKMYSLIVYKISEQISSKIAVNSLPPHNHCKTVRQHVQSQNSHL